MGGKWFAPIKRMRKKRKREKLKNENQVKQKRMYSCSNIEQYSKELDRKRIGSVFFRRFSILLNIIFIFFFTFYYSVFYLFISHLIILSLLAYFFSFIRFLFSCLDFFLFLHVLLKRLSCYFSFLFGLAFNFFFNITLI